MYLCVRISIYPSMCVRMQLTRAINIKDCTPYSIQAAMGFRIGKYINLPIEQERLLIECGYMAIYVSKF